MRYQGTLWACLGSTSFAGLTGCPKAGEPHFVGSQVFFFLRGGLAVLGGFHVAQEKEEPAGVVFLLLRNKLGSGARFLGRALNGGPRD